MKDDLISIIIPIYKVNLKFLEICLNSVRKQTYKNIEVLLILDGTDEKTKMFCQEFAKKDQRFYVFSRENRGVSFSRNEGIQKASGKWVTFIDADDWVEEDMCEICINKIQEKNTEYDFIMLRGYINTDKQEEIKYSIANDCEIDKAFKLKLFQSTYGTKFGKFPCCEAVWKNLFRREFLISEKITFDIDLKIGEDMLFNYDVWLKSNLAYFIDKPVYHYRKHNDSVMQTKSYELILKYEDLFNKFEYVVEKLPKEYQINHELFVLRQIERFALEYFFYESIKFSEFKQLLKKEYYKNNIKLAKLNVLRKKRKVFTFLLKSKLYMVLAIICICINKIK